MQPLFPTRIIKLGGSLLNLVDLQQRFHSWLTKQPPARNLIVAGGGQAVEAIRELDAIHRFSSKLTHWLCVDLMSTTATLASEVLGLEEPIATKEQLSEFLSTTSSLSNSLTACIQPSAYYTPSIAQYKKCALPESWDCTSDSIAAWLASSLGAEQLVLLKSTDCGCSPLSGLSATAIRALADCHAVDPIFPESCQVLGDVRIVNLRNTA